MGARASALPLQCLEKMNARAGVAPAWNSFANCRMTALPTRDDEATERRSQTGRPLNEGRGVARLTWARRELHPPLRIKSPLHRSQCFEPRTDGLSTHHRPASLGKQTDETRPMPDSGRRLASIISDWAKHDSDLGITIGASLRKVAAPAGFAPALSGLKARCPRC